MVFGNPMPICTRRDKHRWDRKCKERIRQFVHRGATIRLFVHNDDGISALIGHQVFFALFHLSPEIVDLRGQEFGGPLRGIEVLVTDTGNDNGFTKRVPF